MMAGTGTTGSLASSVAVKRGPGRPPKNAGAPLLATAAPATPGKRGRKPFSAATRAKMAAAQAARWAAKRGGVAAPSAPAAKPAKAGKRNVSPEVRARLAAAMKARWAAAKRKGLPGPNARK